MMGRDDITISVLKEIRDEIRETNARLGQTNARLDQTNMRLDRVDTRLEDMNARLDLTNARLELTNTKLEDGLAGLRTEFRSALAESEMRTATAINENTFAVREMSAMLRDRFDLRGRVERCERDIDELKRKVP